MLQQRGFKAQSPAFGLCSYAAVYAHDDTVIPEIARALVRINGVDFTVYKSDAHAVVESDRGQARIEYAPATESYRYVNVSGDRST
jgi:hypothetical protein